MHCSKQFSHLAVLSNPQNTKTLRCMKYCHAQFIDEELQVQKA